MARIISILFSPPEKDMKCSRVLESHLNITFIQENDDEMTRYLACCLGLNCVLFNNHGLVNDMGIRFEDYEYELDMSVVSSRINASIVESYLNSASRYVFHVISEVLCWKSCLVDDLQKLLESFEPEIFEDPDNTARC